MLYTLCRCGTNELELESLSNESKLLLKIRNTVVACTSVTWEWDGRPVNALCCQSNEALGKTEVAMSLSMGMYLNE